MSPSWVSIRSRSAVILRLIRRLNDALGMTSIVVSHDVHEIIHGGRPRCTCCPEARSRRSGTPEELQTYPSEIVEQFIGGLADGPVPFHFPAPDYFGELLERSEPAFRVIGELRRSLVECAGGLGRRSAFSCCGSSPMRRARCCDSI